MVSPAHDPPDRREGKLYFFTQKVHGDMSRLGRGSVSLLSLEGRFVDGEIPRYGAQHILLRYSPVALLKRVLKRLFNQTEVNVRLRIAV